MPKPCAVCKGKPVYFGKLCVDCLRKAHDEYVNKMTNPDPYNPDTAPLHDEQSSKKRTAAEPGSAVKTPCL